MSDALLQSLLALRKACVQLKAEVRLRPCVHGWTS